MSLSVIVLLVIGAVLAATVAVFLHGRGNARERNAAGQCARCGRPLADDQMWMEGMLVCGGCGETAARAYDALKLVFTTAGLLVAGLVTTQMLDAWRRGDAIDPAMPALAVAVALFYPLLFRYIRADMQKRSDRARQADPAARAEPGLLAAPAPVFRHAGRAAEPVPAQPAEHRA